jgi:DNA-binding CsgD family transcriptional regulator
MLLGREAERARIESLLAGARAGRGASLLIRGEPGIGKTALLAYAEEQASGMRVLHAHGVEAEADLPFSAPGELLRPLMGLLYGLPETQAKALRGVFELESPVEGKLLVGLAMVSLLSPAAEEQPLLCLVDDAHWLDVASSEAFVFAVRRLEDDPVAFVFGTRVGEPRRFQVPGAHELLLDGLTRAEAQELIGGAGSQLSAAAVGRLHEAVNGNPLALLELPPALADAQRSGMEPLPEPLPVTEAVQQAFARRIELLPEETQQALVVAAAEPSGRTPPVQLALAALGLRSAALEPAEDEGLFGFGGGRVTFRHPLVRAAAYHGARPSERRRVHRALADAAAGADEEAATALEAVAESAKAQGTLVAAAIGFERAAGLSPEAGQRARRLCRAARAYARIRGVDAFLRGRDVVAEALPRADEPSLRNELEYWEAFFEIEAEPRRAYDLLLARATALEAADSAFAALLAAEAGFVALRRLEIADLLAASAAAHAYSRRSPERPDPYVVAIRAMALVASGRLAAAGALQAATDALIEQARALVTGRSDYAEEFLPINRWPTMYLATMLVADTTQEHTLLATLDPGRAAFSEVGDGAATVAGGYAARIDFDAGRWNDARAGFADTDRVCRELGENNLRWYVVANLAQLAAARGAESDCHAYGETTAAITSAVRTVHSRRAPGFTGTGSLGLLALGRADYERAVEEYERALLPSLGPFVLSHELADAIEAYVRVGRRTDAERWLVPYAAQAQASGWAWAQARAAHLGLLLADDDRLEEAFAVAIGFHERAEQPFPRARTELVYGERLRRAGLRRQAREHLRAALETFERLGAAPWAEHAAAELRATGERVRRRSDPDTSQLTPQELQVALVVARGATNKEAAAQLYLSPKTIEKHLGSGYTKLGLRSRTELARVIAGGMPQPDMPAAV